MTCDWYTFTREWEKPYRDVKSILRYLNTCPTLMEKLRIDDLNTPEGLDAHHKDWLWLLSKFGGMEKEFFKPWWVLVSKTSLDLFIDLSDPCYPLFAFEYNFTKPYCYFRNYMFTNIRDLLAINEAEFDFDAFHEERLLKVLKQYDEYSGDEGQIEEQF